ncbi:hypothetical protein [Streptomyces sp. NPDC017988]|uniref:hypothetical protein n=1 Tax=Streptomyces sp. NPDC017988 TaxID=3365025 RepID=UPI0037AA4821
MVDNAAEVELEPSVERLLECHLATTGLGAAGRQAQNRLGQHVEWLETQASRARGLYERMNAGSATGLLAARKQETQV